MELQRTAHDVHTPDSGHPMRISVGSRPSLRIPMRIPNFRHAFPAAFHPCHPNTWVTLLLLLSYIDSNNSPHPPALIARLGAEEGRVCCHGDGHALADGVLGDLDHGGEGTLVLGHRHGAVGNGCVVAEATKEGGLGDWTEWQGGAWGW